ncbi:MAG TPA: hypothetical protein VF297_27175 [Pyrinomonadaceae bacterium]
MKARLHIGGNFAAAVAVAVAALPKCPLCLMALLGSVGLGGVVGVGWLRPLTSVLLLLSVGALAFRARRRRGLGPFYLGSVAAALILLGGLAYGRGPHVYLGAGMLLGASAWNSLPKKGSRAERPGCDC